MLRLDLKRGCDIKQDIKRVQVVSMWPLLTKIKSHRKTIDTEELVKYKTICGTEKEGNFKTGGQVM